MLTVFIETLSPMLVLFAFMAVGFSAKKLNILPDGTASVLAKLETNIIFPALNFITMARNCTPDTISTHIVNIILASLMMLFAIALAILISLLLIKENSSERGVYKYALAFANSSYVGDPLILGMFGERMLSFYKMYTFPLTLGIYSFGLRCLIPKEKQKKNPFLELINPSIIALVLGIIFGLFGFARYLPDFAVSTLDGLKGCMGPLAMILAGFTVASYPLSEMFSDKKIYIATLLRLIVIPSVIVIALFGLKELLYILFSLNIGNGVLYLAFFATSAPLGLNTIIFPAAYGANPKVGAGMAMISHSLCVITIPLMYSLMSTFFGNPQL